MLIRLVFSGSIFLILGTLIVWNTGILWFLGPLSPVAVKVAYSGIPVLTGLALIAALISHQYIRIAALIFTITAATCGMIFFLELPSNNREWQSDVAKLASAEMTDKKLIIRNVRNFRYIFERDYESIWETRQYNLEHLDSLDMFAVYWMGDAIAHTILSFGFGDERLAISIEIRKEKKENFSAIAGFFRQYELVYSVGEERDIIGLRTTFRDPPEDVFLYNLDVSKPQILKLLRLYVQKINRLYKAPEFYNTAITNCTTDILTHVKLINENYPKSWKILLSGYFPEHLYENGLLRQDMAFDQLRQLRYVNPRSNPELPTIEYSKMLRL